MSLVAMHDSTAAQIDAAVASAAAAHPAWSRSSAAVRAALLSCQLPGASGSR